MKKLLLLPLFLMAQSSFAASINGAKFVRCFEKAMNERIQEIKKEAPKMENKMCDSLSEEAKRRLIDLYTFKGDDGLVHYYSAYAMGEENVRFHHDRVQFELDCYKESKFLGTLFVKRLGQAFKDLGGGKPHHDMQLAEDALSKMLGRAMWTENGSDYFDEHDFAYCDDV